MDFLKINEIDKLISEIKTADKDRIPEIREKILEAICQAIELQTNRSIKPDKKIFNPTKSESQEQFIALCLLRLLCNKSDAIWDDVAFRQKTFQLFDQKIGQIYKSLKIDKESQNHEKMSKLQDIESNIFKEFQGLTNKMINLDAAIQTQKDFLKALKSPINSIFLETFTNRSQFNDELINEVFKLTRDYSNTSTSSRERFILYDKLTELVTPFLLEKDISKYSVFTSKCLIAPISKIYEYVKKDFAQAESVKPTNVSVKGASKKYPFHKLGEKIRIDLIVENEGLGHAFDVSLQICDIDDCLKLIDLDLEPVLI